MLSVSSSLSLNLVKHEVSSIRLVGVQLKELELELVWTHTAKK